MNRGLYVRRKPKLCFSDRTAIERIASWNWIKGTGNEPAIVVPGHPPKWTPPESKRTPQLEPDPRAVVLPHKEHPYLFEALFTAAAICISKAKLDKYELVIESKHLVNLLQWTMTKTAHEALTFNVEVHGKLVLVQGSYTSEFRHPFTKTLKKHTTEYCAGFQRRSVSVHHQAVGYRVGGLNMIVEYPVDCFTCSCHLENDNTDSTCPVEDQRFSFRGKPQRKNHGTLKVWQHGTPYDRLNSDCTATILAIRGSRTFPTFNGHAYDSSEVWFSALEQVLVARERTAHNGVFECLPTAPEDWENELELWAAAQATAPYLRTVMKILHSMVREVRQAPLGQGINAVKRYTFSCGFDGHAVIVPKLVDVTKDGPRLLPEGFDIKAT